jgi:rare lipoprotein A
MVANNVPSSEIVTTVPAPKTTVLTRIKSGMASWYGSVLHGHLTASGRRFNMYELTAAHRTLPFGSRVKVTDLRNHRSVVVTITDRGVLYPERVIDLSWGAAKELNMLKMGVDPVKLELIPSGVNSLPTLTANLPWFSWLPVSPGCLGSSGV